MAIGNAANDSIERAEVTYCYERDVRRDGTVTVRQLPWAWLRFGADGEERQYVLTSFAPGITRPGTDLLPQPPEYMRFAPFPYELYRPATGNGPNVDLNKPGPVGVHFLNNI